MRNAFESCQKDDICQQSPFDPFLGKIQKGLQLQLRSRMHKEAPPQMSEQRARPAPQISSGTLMTLDTDTSKELWVFDLDAPSAIGGTSIGNGMLPICMGLGGQVPNACGYIVAFGAA